MKPFPFALLLLLAASAVHAQDKPLQLDAKTQTRLQLRVAPIQAAHSSDSVTGFASVVDQTPLLTILSELATAQSAYNASQVEATRTQALAKDATVATKVAEAAVAAAHADQARVTLLQQRLALEWGTYFSNLSDQALRQLGGDLASGRAALVRIDTPSGQGLKGARSATLDLGALGSVEARVLGIARTADQRLQSPGLMSLVTGPNAAYLSNGLTMKATLYNGGGSSGLLIPNAALLRSGGKIYAFVKTGPQAFVQRPVTATKVTPDGLIVGDGFQPGEQVVVQGASALLTAATSTLAGE